MGMDVLELERLQRLLSILMGPVVLCSESRLYWKSRKKRSVGKVSTIEDPMFRPWRLYWSLSVRRNLEL